MVSSWSHGSDIRIAPEEILGFSEKNHASCAIMHSTLRATDNIIKVKVDIIINQKVSARTVQAKSIAFNQSKHSLDVYTAEECSERRQSDSGSSTSSRCSRIWEIHRAVRFIRAIRLDELFNYELFNYFLYADIACYIYTQAYNYILYESFKDILFLWLGNTG